MEASMTDALKHPYASNKLLALLPDRDYDEIKVDLEYVVLPRGSVLAEVGKRIDYVYFMTAGIGSLVTKTPEGRYAEAGIFGWDGYVPTTAMAGVEYSSHNVNVQIPGAAYRIEYDAFRSCMERSRNFSKVVVRSIEAFSVQLAHTAVSNAVHDVNVRLARWLLMCHDRVSDNEIRLTHEYISQMLAVRRPSVTTSLQTLEGEGLIRSERGLITIRNRSGLEWFARDAYGKPELEYRRLMKDLF
jgi:CRP-like cAMP-binding protein